MYLVCYVILARTNAIFPVNWIKDNKSQIVKYINRGLNSNQKLLGYFSQRRFNEIQNGQNPSDFQPNFSLPMGTEFPGDGCYFVLPKKCFENLAEASSLVDGHRNNPPPVYNEERERERPFPNVSHDDGNDANSDDDFAEIHNFIETNNTSESSEEGADNSNQGKLQLEFQ